MEPPQHVNLVHWDDVESEAVNVGELRSTQQSLGESAGAFRAGVTRVRVAPGARSSPVHVHADEEEFFYVLDGCGLSWQDGVTYPIARGDVLCHRVHEEAHTLIAGNDGLDVLAFGPQSEPNITWLPHAQVMRIGPRWVPAEVDDPFEAERRAGPIPLPPEPTATARSRSRTSKTSRPLFTTVPATRAASATSGPSWDRRPPACVMSNWLPRALSCPPHWHTAEEELFVVLDGEGEALLDDETIPIRAGSVLARPPEAREAHALRAGTGGLTYLAWGTRVPGDLVYYPRSRKVNIGELLFRVEPLDYWDGE